MAHPLSHSADNDDIPQLEAKSALSLSHDDPLQAAAPLAGEDQHHQNGKAERGHAGLQSKPIRIPNSILDELKDRDSEATPTAYSSAFPKTPTSSSSVRAPNSAESESNGPEDGDQNDNDRNNVEGLQTSEDSSSPSVLQQFGHTATRAVQPLSIAALRAKVCKAAARGDLEGLIAVLHPSSQAENSHDDPGYPSSFALVNSPTSSGLTPLLEAASHGHLHIVQHLLDEEGAVRDLEDVEGENAFLKASYRGHLDVMKYLAEGEEDGTDINSTDRQGWTALHNAASKGYLEVVMWLAERGATIDARSTQGYTPLMNAASKGHLPIVRYLLARHSPDPFIRNAYSETAYDVAVATFELGIADILANYESQLWQDRQTQSDDQPQSDSPTRGSNAAKPYNLLGMHITVPIVVYENQRLDLRWLSRTKRTISNPIPSTNHSSDSNVKFTSAALSRRDGHASSELPPSYDGINGSGHWIPVKRSDIGLPSILNPRQIRLPAHNRDRPALQRNTNSSRSTKQKSSSLPPSTANESSHPSSSTVSSSSGRSVSSDTESPPETAEEAWFWLSSQYFVDLSPSNIDPEQGWQYARSFDEPDDGNWYSEVPLEVINILGGGELPRKGVKWVRRRRWARVMRRRIDIPHWGFDDDLPSVLGANDAGEDGQDVVVGAGDEEMCNPSQARDYLERAQYFAGSHTRTSTQLDTSTSESHGLDYANDDDSTSLRSAQTVIADVPDGEPGNDRSQGRKIIARLERALQELHEGIEGDQDEVRKLQAVTLAEIFEERLQDLRRQFPQVDDDDDAESFRYPGADDDSELDETSSISTSLRSASLYSPISHGSPASFRRSSDALSLPYGSPASRQQALSPVSMPRPDLSRQLSTNPDFRVPTSEGPHPGRSTLPGNQPSTSQPQRSAVQWEPDDSTSECRRCQRKFTFFLRKHHCRKCGLVVCAHCSSHHDFLRAGEVVLEPGTTVSSGFEPLYGMYSSEGGFYRTCDICHEAIRDAVNSVDPNLLLSPHYFTSPRLGISSSMGPTTSSVTTAMPTPTLAHYTQALDNGANPSEVTLSPAMEGQGGLDGSAMQGSVSDMSELGECPVCGTNLEDIPDKTEQERHVQNCLESGTSSRLQDNRYLVFTLPDSSPLVGTDCLICFESYQAGEQIGRLSCLCHFHRHCIANWLSRGKSCPVHAR